MLHTILFADEITVWWDKEWERPDGLVYRVLLDGQEMGQTVYTHFTLAGLTEKTTYTVAVECVDDGRSLGELTLATPAAKRRIDVTKPPYSAVGDGVTMNTAALQQAINDCGAADCVYLPKGTFLTGALDLHSDMELYVDEGAVLHGSQIPADYLPKRRSRFEGIEMECYASLLNMGEHDPAAGPNCRNVVIRGGGSILGGGKPLCDGIMDEERARLAAYLAENADYVKTCENENTIPGRARGRLIHISNSENVIIAGLTLGFAASWNIHFIYSKNIVTYGCRVLSRGVWNGDGWDPDSSENCVIFDTEFQTHDNSIAVKSGKNPEGNRIGRPTTGVRIFHCRGGNCMALGSEMSGGIYDTAIWDCDFTESGSGIGLKVTPKRGGVVRDVRVRNCRFVNIRIRSVPFNDDGEPAGVLPVIEDVLFENIELTGIAVALNGERKPTELMLISGIDGKADCLRRVTLDGVSIPCLSGPEQRINIKNVEDLTIRRLSYREE